MVVIVICCILVPAGGTAGTVDAIDAVDADVADAAGAAVVFLTAVVGLVYAGEGD
jgi:hypothetical protein